MKVLLHMNPEPVSCVLDGILHTLYTGIPYEVEDHIPLTQGTGRGSPKAPEEVRTNPDFIGEKIVEHLWWAGVVEVPVERTATGNRFLVEEAKQAAVKELNAADQKTFDEYREIQSNRAQEGKPPLPPVGRYLTVIQRRGIDIRKFGINPVGANLVDEQAAQGMEVAQLKNQLSEMQNQMQQLLAQMSEKKSKAKVEA